MFSGLIKASDSSCRPQGIYVVRHVEKQLIPPQKDPPLSKLGFKHAQALAQKLKNIHFDHIFSSQFKRTQLTVAPLANLQNREIEIYSATETKKLAQNILKGCHQNILIAGHSNTVPDFLSHLGLKMKATIGGQALNYSPQIYLNEKLDYGSLFIVTFTKQDQPKLNIQSF